MRTKNNEPVEGKMRRPGPPYGRRIDTIPDPEGFPDASDIKMVSAVG